MLDYTINILGEFWKVLGEMSPYLLFGFFVAGILSIFISPELIQKHLGKSGFKDVFKASLFGVPLPLCSCGVIPLGASLRRTGASKGATISFLISTPQTGIDSILVTYGLLGPVFAIVRPVVAFLSGLLAGTFVNVLIKETDLLKQAEPVKSMHKEGLNNIKKNKLVQALQYGFITIPKDIGKALIVGLLLAGIIAVIIPEDFFSGIFGSGILAMIVIMLLSLPVYICSTSSVPIAAALILKGLSPGAALVLLIAGPAANAATISTVWKIMGKRVTFIYLSVMAFTAVGSGMLLDFIQADLFKNYHISHAGWMMPEIINNISAVILLGLLFYSFYEPKNNYKKIAKHEINTTIKLTIDGMSCHSCVDSVRKALLDVDGVVTVNVTLKPGEATVDGKNISISNLSAVIETAGYTVTMTEEHQQQSCCNGGNCSL